MLRLFLTCPFVSLEEISNTMKLKIKFEMVNIGNEIIAVPVADNSDLIKGVFRLNKEGKEIIDLLSEGATEIQIVDQLAKKYCNDRDSLQHYTHNVINTLKQYKVLED